MLRFLKQRDQLKDLASIRTKYTKHPLPDVVYENLAALVPDRNTPLEQLSFLVVDFETTGFEPEKSDIISMGWVEISHHQIDFATSEHIYVDNSNNINHQTAVINHIVPQMVRDGVSLESAVLQLLERSRNKILVAHGKIIEKRFLDFYAQTHLNIPELPLVWIDTLRIEQWRSLEKGKQWNKDNRLTSVRTEYNLPQYAAHNALIDAIATAELLLAQLAHTYKHKSGKFGHLFKISQ
ncbi:exonuclease domain-containing protein [Vibrio hannami]|uniref:exonuclease domain-containing protein n=1 Tax=Vibrio hannami TaxID=2717094 RepID=UPI0024108179|nr:exonuclease domain-containing protein [Vibrio hannami]MDG3089006.1 exonuclease domain-containing protein [Vibrio hannami]